MPNRGFEEAHSSYVVGPDAGLVGQVRRFGPEGPAYEVLRLVGKSDAWISVIQSGEELAYPIAEALADPIAEAVP